MLRRSSFLTPSILKACCKERNITPYPFNCWYCRWSRRGVLRTLFLSASDPRRRIKSCIRLSPYRHISILDNLAQSQTKREWHDPSFMEGESPENKEAWLSSFLEKSRPSVDARAYLVVIKGWAVSGVPSAPHKAEEWISRLERHYQSTSDNDTLLQPTVDHFNAVVKAWAASHESNSVVRAERWLNKLRSNKDLQPTTESYNLFLDACSKGDSKRNEILRANAERAEATLREMIRLHKEDGDGFVRPTTASFNFVIRAWTRCRNDMTMAEKVMDVLRAMELHQRTSGTHDEPVKANTMSYCMAIDAWSVVAGLKAQAALRSNQKRRVQANDSLKSVGLDEVNNAEAVLKYMTDLRDCGDCDVFPNTAAYNALIGAHMRMANEMNIDAPLRAERVLRKMISLQGEGDSDVDPDQRSYNHVIRAWARIKRPNSGERAEWWLRNMWTQFEDTESELIRPNVGTYNAVMEAYYQRPHAAKLEELLLELLTYEEAGDQSLHANTAAFLLVIRGWLKHEELCSEEDSPGKGCRRALKWLDKLIDREEKGIPHAATTPELFVGILKTSKKLSMSCNSTRASKTVFVTALEAFTEFRASRHHVEANAYAWLLQIGLRALSSPMDDNGRTKFIQHLVKACCHDGLVGGNFVSALANGPVRSDGFTMKESERLIEEYFGSWPLPKSWSRNIRKKDDLPSKPDVIRTNFQINDDD